MTDAIYRFYKSIKNVERISQKDKVSFFVYFLTVELGQEAAKARHVNKCFSDCHLKQPTRTAAYLSEGCRSRPLKFIKDNNGYKLEHHYQEKIAEQLGDQKRAQQTSASLRNLENEIPDGASKEFLKESLDCFEAGAHRATITMVWILAINHLYSHILKHSEQLADFNEALGCNRDKRIRITNVSKRDDFCEIPDGKFIEFCRQAEIISNDVRKILEASLDTRNSSAHPSGIKIKESKVIAFVEDLVTNVMQKYQA